MRGAKKLVGRGLGQGGMHATVQASMGSDGVECEGGMLACTHCGEEGQCKNTQLKELYSYNMLMWTSVCVCVWVCVNLLNEKDGWNISC